MLYRSLKDTTPVAPRLDWPVIYQRQADAAQDRRLKRFFQAGLPAPDSKLAELEFVALDLETTGLSVEVDDIVSVGMVPFTLQRIRCNASRNWVVRPRTPLQEEAIVIHGITHSEVRQAPRLGSIIGEVLDALEGKVAIVHCKSVEQQFLGAALERLTGQRLLFPVIDTMAQERVICAKRPVSWWQAIWGRKPMSLRLPDCRQRYHLPHYTAHHATLDAVAAAELFIAQVQHHIGDKALLRDLWE